MIVAWIYDTPTWLSGSIFVVLTTLIACLGLLVVHRFVNVELRSPNNEVAAAFFGIAGTSYAVLIAFIAVNAWQSYADADRATTEEAIAIGNLYADTVGLPKASAGALRDDIVLYLKQVIELEWPGQQHGVVNYAARATLQHIQLSIAALNPVTAGEAVIQGELLRVMNDLYSARRVRQLAVQDAIPAMVWWIIFLGTITTVFYTYIFGLEDIRMHLLLTGSLTISLSLVIVLIVALDRPFRGDLSVDQGAYENVQESIHALAASLPP
jgi:hypothetical protein